MKRCATQHLCRYLLRPVEQYPDAEIVRKILEAMDYMRGAEEQVARTNIGHLVLNAVAAIAGRNEIEFIALMRNLRAVCWASGKSHLQIAVDKNLG